MIRPGVKYTYAQLAQLRDTPEMARWALKGYVWRQALDGTMELVPYAQASGAGGDFASSELRPMSGARGFDLTYDENPWGDLPPRVKRTPQQRLKSLTDRIAEDMRAGRILSEPQLQTYVPEHKTGSDIAGSDVEQVARAFLEAAEGPNEEKESKRVTRTGPSD